MNKLQTIVYGLICSLILVGCQPKENIDTKQQFVRDAVQILIQGETAKMESILKDEPIMIEELERKWAEMNFSGTDFVIEKNGEFSYHVYPGDRPKEKGYVIFRVFEHHDTGTYIDFIQFVAN